ncbi:GrpB family protein [Streptomyces sp. NPDC057908]|uniref:GrpB family protein n=1 Tax=Streptomyces sp. NPDC057908 TaxID=3346276 RepID=UPI0036E9C5F2
MYPWIDARSSSLRLFPTTSIGPFGTRLSSPVSGRHWGDRALEISYTGSAAVPDLMAKDVIDIGLTVAAPGREETYVPQLTALGYDTHLCEPWCTSTACFGSHIHA